MNTTRKNIQVIARSNHIHRHIKPSIYTVEKKATAVGNSFIHRNALHSALTRPPVSLIPLLPGVLDVSEFLLDLLDGVFVAGVLAHVVAEFDGRAAACGGDFDDDVEGFGFFVACFVDEVV